jgi:hypothetical protein
MNKKGEFVSGQTGSMSSETNIIFATLEEIWEFVYNNWDSEVWNLYLDKHPTLK